MSGLDGVFEYVKKNLDNYVDKELSQLISYKTVAHYKETKDDFTRAANDIKLWLEKAGIEEVQLISDFGNPIIYGNKFVDKDLPTVVMYAHYDVQPAEPFDLWKTDPYKLTVENGRMYARGVADDKTLLLSIIKALEAMNDNDVELKYNVKILFEPSEEAGSDELNSMFDKTKNASFELHRELLSNATMIACDTSMLNENKPSINIGVRGCVHFELTVHGANRDIHSGSYGGLVGNPIHELSRLIATIHDENNHITIDGFYDDVNTTDEKRQMSNNIPFDVDFIKNDLGIKNIVYEKQFTPRQSCRLRPTVEVNGIYGGHIKDGNKTIIPSKATAKFSIRMVDNQDPSKIMCLFEKHINKNIDDAYSYELHDVDKGCSAVTTDINCPYFRNVKEAMREEYGEEPLLIRGGGSLPIVSKMQEVLKCNVVFLGFGGATSNSHGPNENYSLNSFERGIRTIIRFLSK